MVMRIVYDLTFLLRIWVGDDRGVLGLIDGSIEFDFYFLEWLLRI